MCRNIRALYNFKPPATSDEIRASAVQYVRKVTGFQKPSVKNEQAFNEAVEKISDITKDLFSELSTSAHPKNREKEAAKRAARRS